MSAKDLCCLEFIDKLKKAGIKAFKIEGRNREPEYVDKVVRIYRKALDKKLTEKEIEKSMEELKKVYNKGFSSGFFISQPTKDDFSSVENSSSSQRKEFIGRVVHYFSDKNVAAIKIFSGKIKVGDELLVMGSKTGIIKHKVERIEINRKPVESAEKGQEIGVKIQGVRKKDLVYLVVSKKSK
jgi:putative protease